MISKDRVAVITGATGGLGSVVAKRLGQEGVRLALIGTSSERLQSLANDLALPEEQVLTVEANLTEEGAAPSSAEKVLEKYGRVDIVLHLVGGWAGGKGVTKVTADEVTDMLNQHLWTTFHLAQAYVPHMQANGWGRIIVVSSPHAVNPPPRMGPYVVGKAAEEALILTVAREVAGSGVTANVLQVRTIDAKHERDEQPTAKNASWTTPEEITAAILNPVGSLGTIGAMGMATAKVHLGKPIWVTSGGAELPVLNMSVALAVALSGPGKYSVDNALGLRLPRRLILVPGLALAAASVAYGVVSSNKVLQQEQMQTQETAQPLTQAESEVMLEVEERPEAVRVPDTIAASELEQASDLAAQEPERIAGAHLQAGEDASHPV